MSPSSPRQPSHDFPRKSAIRSPFRGTRRLFAYSGVTDHDLVALVGFGQCVGVAVHVPTHTPTSGGGIAIPDCRSDRPVGLRVIPTSASTKPRSRYRKIASDARSNPSAARCVAPRHPHAVSWLAGTAPGRPRGRRSLRWRDRARRVPYPCDCGRQARRRTARVPPWSA